MRKRRCFSLAIVDGPLQRVLKEILAALTGSRRLSFTAAQRRRLAIAGKALSPKEQAQDAYPGGAPPARYANDPNERQIKYDLYRIPFNGGKGGKAEPIAGASQNGMSNSFPKISPDGRWLVFVQARSG